MLRWITGPFPLSRRAYYLRALFLKRIHEDYEKASVPAPFHHDPEKTTREPLVGPEVIRKCNFVEGSKPLRQVA